MTFRNPLRDALRSWWQELAEIDRRHYTRPLDHTRASVIRACIRSAEIELVREAREMEGQR